MIETFGVTKKKAEQMLEGYFTMFPKLREFQQKSYQHSVENGYIVADSYIRRKIYLENYEKYLWLRDHKHLNPKFSREFKILDGEIFRKSANFPIQSWGATMTKLGGIFLRKAGLKIILQVHDEYVVECLEQTAEQTKKLVEQCMTKAASFLCKSMSVPAEAKISPKWVK